MAAHGPTQARSTVVVVTWRGRGLVGRCLDALAAQSRPCRVLVVDNASADGTAEELAAHPSCPEVLRLGRNSGYAGALAAALPRVKTPFMGWLNDDAEPERHWLAALESALEGDLTAGAVASVLYDTRGDVVSIGVGLTRLGYGRDITDGVPFGFCGGAALLRAEALREVGGVDGSLFCYYEDTDTAWRLRLAGYRVLAAPDARVRHLGGASARHGTRAFHHWNERNRLLVLLRCAPPWVAGREVARFATLTLVLPLRRSRPPGPHFRFGVRSRVLAEVGVRLPRTLLSRYRIGRPVVHRSVVWRRWAGSHAPE